MRAQTYKLETFRDDSTGFLGFATPGMPRDETTNAGAGLQIAHDLLEHVNGQDQIGGITDELEALGAIWLWRGQFGVLRKDGAGSAYTVHENIAADITRMFADHVRGDQYVDYSPLRTRAGDQEFDFQQIMEDARRGRFSDFS